MKILAIEFSSQRRSVAVVIAGNIRSRAEQTSGRATPGFDLIEQALREAGLEREDVECLAVGLGPGSYTGVRSAISIAQGWQIARSVDLLGVGRIETLAAQAQAANWLGRVHILINAQRNELYFAAYEIDARHRRLVESLRLASIHEVQAHLRAGEVLIEPDLLPSFPQGRVLFPDAGTLGLLASERRDFVAGSHLEPIYLRKTSFTKAAPPRVIPAL
jgi:tRNA threonylcarbamoyl adenosine modification protein YeaZ